MRASRSIRKLHSDGQRVGIADRPGAMSFSQCVFEQHRASRPESPSFSVAYLCFDFSCEKEKELSSGRRMPLPNPSNWKGDEETASRRHHLGDEQRRGGRGEPRKRKSDRRIVEMGISGLIGIDSRIVHAVIPNLSRVSERLFSFEDMASSIARPVRATSAVATRRECTSDRRDRTPAPLAARPRAVRYHDS